MSEDRRVECGPVHLSPADLAAYTDRISRLAARVRLMRKKWNPTLKRNEAKKLAAQLVELADYLDDTGTLQFDLEELHDRPLPLPVGEDGRPYAHAYAEVMQSSYKATIWRIRQLAESARQVAAELPHPTAKIALPFAVMGFLHLRERYEFLRPRVYAAGPDVAALAVLTEQAGIHLSDETLRNALGKGLKNFEEGLFPLGIYDFLQ